VRSRTGAAARRAGTEAAAGAAGSAKPGVGIRSVCSAAMARVRHRWSATDPDLSAALTAPRSDLVVERVEGDGTFSLATGPFRSYRRTLERDGDELVETTDYVLGIPWWGWLLAVPVRRTLRRPPPRHRSPWWAPPDVLDERAASSLALLAGACLVFGYLNTLFTQTVAFAADEFGASEEAQGVAGTVVRFGIVFALAVVILADRIGRRRTLVGAAFAAPVLTALGALAPSFAVLTITQMFGRPLAIALGLIVGIVAMEEMPRNSRAYALSLLALSTGLGAGFAVMALPLADLGVRGWRLTYVLALAFLPIAIGLRRRLPESRRFEVAHPSSPHLPKWRLAMVAATGFLLNLLVAPASFFQNRYLKDVRGYSATLIALFTLATNTPGGIGVIAGGRLADLHGRRIVGAIGVFGAAIGTVATFYVAGAPMWLASTATAIVGGSYIPALGVYTTELFPTGRRGLANGIIAATSLVGSSIGLLVAGAMLDNDIDYGPVMAVLAVGPLLVTILVAVAYPETAHLELEQINPEDRVPGAAPVTTVALAGGTTAGGGSGSPPPPSS
jgi:MFS family permease